MKKIRIGKDIAIAWHITLPEGNNELLAEMDLTIAMKDPKGLQITIKDYVVNGNDVLIGLKGTAFAWLGNYTLTLWKNKGKDGQTVVDAVNAFALVNSTDKETDDGSTGSGVMEISTVDLYGELTFTTHGFSPVVRVEKKNGETIITATDKTGTTEARIKDGGDYLRGKTWAMIGDSLTAKTSYTAKSYYDYIVEETGINVVNLAVGGSGYRLKNEDDEAFYQKELDIPANADIVTVFGGFNDIASLDIPEFNAQIGNVSDSTTSTICGCINQFFDVIYNINPAIRIGVISPTPWKSMAPKWTDSPAYEYVEKLRTICRYHSVPFLDLFNASGLRPWDAKCRLALYSKDVVEGQVDPRGTHPNELGHQILAPKIREFLKTL